MLTREPFNYKAWELDRLTIPECFWQLEDPEKRAPSGALNMTDDEIEEENARYRLLTPLQKLDEKLDNMTRV